MSDLIFTTTAFGIGAIVSLLLLFHFWKNKRQHKDFLLGVFSFCILSVFSLYGFYLSLVDTIDLAKGDIASTSGKCEIFISEDVGGRFGTSNILQVNVNDVLAEGDPEDFPDLEEGIFNCTIEYTRKTQSLLTIEIE